jgi:hypothetical protein
VGGVSEGLKYQYHTAWPVVLGVLAVLAEVSLKNQYVKICSKFILLMLESVMQVGEHYYFDTGLGLTCSSVPVVVRVVSRRPRNSVRSRVSGRIFPLQTSENFLLFAVLRMIP